MNLLELAEKVEKARGADASLNHAIWYRVVLPEQPEMIGGFPSYTGSLDAALLLVPEGYIFNLGNGEMCWATVGPKSADFLSRHVAEVERCATPALALCAAALKARALQGEG